MHVGFILCMTVLCLVQRHEFHMKINIHQHNNRKVSWCLSNVKLFKNLWKREHFAPEGVNVQFSRLLPKRLYNCFNIQLCYICTIRSWVYYDTLVSFCILYISDLYHFTNIAPNETQWNHNRNLVKSGVLLGLWCIQAFLIFFTKSK